MMYSYIGLNSRETVPLINVTVPTYSRDVPNLLKITGRLCKLPDFAGGIDAN